MTTFKTLKLTFLCSSDMKCFERFLIFPALYHFSQPNALKIIFRTQNDKLKFF